MKMAYLSIDASAETLMRQAAHTAEYYYDRAVEYTKGVEDYRDRTMLIAAFLQTAASDFQAAMILAASQNIEAAITDLANAYRDANDDEIPLALKVEVAERVKAMEDAARGNNG
jgi:hypothetical protein